MKLKLFMQAFQSFNKRISNCLLLLSHLLATTITTTATTATTLML